MNIPKIMIFSITLLLVLCLSSFCNTLLPVDAQSNNSTQLPILLIHGYGERSDVWDSWMNWLDQDTLSNVYPITFTNDRCGSSQEHAMELENKINDILDETGSEKVNVVAHSKGGLDTRWYLASNNMDPIANLIMIGTPNAGSPAAWVDWSGCWFGSDFDLLPGSVATRVADKPDITNYYTITGDWMPDRWCPTVFGTWFEDGNCFIPGPDDKLVPVDSVNPSPDYIPIGPPWPYDHFELLNQKDVYDTVSPILKQ
jgi:pimeloyl-ACP methyl ester carboxylesterase